MKPFDVQGAFRPVTGGLRHMAMRGVAATLLSSGMGLAVQVVATVVLARLLKPEDFGLVTMVTTFSLLLSNCGANGFTEALIQREDLDHALATNIFWINLGVGALLTAGFAAAGSLLSRFYGDPRIVYVAAAISLTIFFSSTWVVHTALLKRAMRFSVISANDIFARAVSVVVSIVLARAGWGYWALAGGTVAVPLSTSIGAWILCRWTPGLPRRIAGTGSMVRFAIHVYGRFTVNYCARNMDNLLVGWRFNAVSLGFYKKAYDLFALSSGSTRLATDCCRCVGFESIEPGFRSVQALPSWLFRGCGIYWNGCGGRLDTDRTGFDSCTIGAGMGAFGPHFHVLRARYRHHDALWYA